MVPGADANGLVAPRRTGKSGEMIEDQIPSRRVTSAGPDRVTTFPHHSADRAAKHICKKAFSLMKVMGRDLKRAYK